MMSEAWQKYHARNNEIESEIAVDLHDLAEAWDRRKTNLPYLADDLRKLATKYSNYDWELKCLEAKATGH